MSSKKRLFSAPIEFVRRLGRTLHLSKFLKRGYFLLFSPLNRTRRLEFENRSYLFCLRDYTDLLYFRNLFGQELDEKPFLGALLGVLAKGDTALDVGASVGLYALFMAGAVGPTGQVIAFEPEVVSFATLKKNIKLNHLNNVLPFRAALGATDGEGDLVLNDHMGLTSSSLLGSGLGGKTEKVTIRRGDGIFKEYGLQVPKAVKVDVEGFEMPVLLGLQSTLKSETCRILCCEFHGRQGENMASRQDLLDLIRAFGFAHICSLPRGGQEHWICTKPE